jgi:putative hydrolase of HD superfamily
MRHAKRQTDLFSIPHSPMPSPRLSALLALQALEDLPRTGWIQHGIPDPERIAGHILGAQYLAISLSERVQPGLDLGRVLELLLVHDASASRLLPPGAKSSAEARAADELLAPLSPQARERFDEYAAASTREARFARLCDRLQLAVRLYGYCLRGRRGLEDFELGLRSLDASEFAPAEELLCELRSALRAVASAPEGT